MLLLLIYSRHKYSNKCLLLQSVAGILDSVCSPICKAQFRIPRWNCGTMPVNCSLSLAGGIFLSQLKDSHPVTLHLSVTGTPPHGPSCERSASLCQQPDSGSVNTAVLDGVGCGCGCWAWANIKHTQIHSHTMQWLWVVWFTCNAQCLIWRRLHMQIRNSLKGFEQNIILKCPRELFSVDCIWSSSTLSTCNSLCVF